MQTQLSWIFLILFSLFFLMCTRLKGNIKYAGALIRDVVAVRERENLFDVTVRESSFMILAVLLSACSIGVLLYYGVRFFGDNVANSVLIPGIGLHLEGLLLPMSVCMGIAIAYMGGMWICYYLVGNVFSDKLHSRMWVRCFTSSVALGVILFFPLALVALTYPQLTKATTIFGLIVLILVKFLFIVKGFRIFFTESSLWVVFLYYLCSLEIIPLSIVFGLACSLLG